jgi:hypothetical protein
MPETSPHEGVDWNNLSCAAYRIQCPVQKKSLQKECRLLFQSTQRQIYGENPRNIQTNRRKDIRKNVRNGIEPASLAYARIDYLA